MTRSKRRRGSECAQSNATAEDVISDSERGGVGHYPLGAPHVACPVHSVGGFFVQFRSLWGQRLATWPDEPKGRRKTE
jgi:hypothetical protein